VKTHHPASADSHRESVSSTYEIRIKGRLSNAVTARFGDLTSTVEPVETILSGDVRDQAELYGLLDLVQSLGLELIEVRRVSGKKLD
jgi:hypothetical protein